MRFTRDPEKNMVGQEMEKQVSVPDGIDGGLLSFSRASFTVLGNAEKLKYRRFV